MTAELNDTPLDPDLSHMPAAQPTPGELIRAARTRANLTLEELAAQSKLARVTLDALERDDFGALVEPVYVRGYYRKCAKILQIPEDELIQAYARRVNPNQPRTPAKIRLSANASSGDWATRVMGMVLVLVVIGLGVVLWIVRETPPTDSTPPVSELMVPVESQPVVDVTADDAPETTADTAPDTPEPEAGEPAVAVETSAPIIATTPVTASPPAAVMEGEGRLNLSFTETSWARINDAEGKSLLNGLMNAGQQQVVQGRLPLTVFLGNAPGVELRFNGERIPLAPFTTGNNTARFSLPLSR